MNPVFINTLFELLGAALAVHNVLQATKLKPTGVSYAMVGWSALWAIECVSYYRGHGETLSACCAVVRSLSSALWLVFALTPRKA